MLAEHVARWELMGLIASGIVKGEAIKGGSTRARPLRATLGKHQQNLLRGEDQEIEPAAGRRSGNLLWGSIVDGRRTTGIAEAHTTSRKGLI